MTQELQGSLPPHIQRLIEESDQRVSDARARVLLKPSWHINLRFRGAQAKQDLFNWIISQYDGDWPYGLPDDEMELCTQCGGFIWKAPAFEARELHMLVQQINSQSRMKGHLRLKIKRLCREDQCVATAGPPVSIGVTAV